MSSSRRPPASPAARLLAFASIAALAPRPLAATDWQPLRDLAAPSVQSRESAARRLVVGGDRQLIPPLVDAVFFTPKSLRSPLFEALSALAGEDVEATYHGWVEYVARHGDLVGPVDYLDWKAELFARIDSRYREILAPGTKARIRIAEIVSGGVRVEGIPALDFPPHRDASEVGESIEPDETVFGAKIGGEARAYPARYLDWHELVNDEIGGVSVALSYCTLCRSAVLFDARVARGRSRSFGTSGLLFRSNKLMIERDSLDLWSNLTGEAVLGEAAASGARLVLLPLTRTSWAEWREREPSTTVVLLEPESGRRWGYVYRPGLAEATRAAVRFPVGPVRPLVEAREEIFALVDGSDARVYRLTDLFASGLVHDSFGGRRVLVVADRESGAIRAYESGDLRWSRSPAGELRDSTGCVWEVSEEALRSTDCEAAQRPRLVGQIAYWFGFQAFYPTAEVWRPGAPGDVDGGV